MMKMYLDNRIYSNIAKKGFMFSDSPQNKDNRNKAKIDLVMLAIQALGYVRLSAYNMVSDDGQDNEPLPDWWPPHIPDPKRRDDPRPHYPPGQPRVPPWMPPGPATPNPNFPELPPAAIHKDLYTIILN